MTVYGIDKSMVNCDGNTEMRASLIYGRPSLFGLRVFRLASRGAQSLSRASRLIAADGGAWSRLLAFLPPRLAFASKSREPASFILARGIRLFQAHNYSAINRNRSEIRARATSEISNYLADANLPARGFDSRLARHKDIFAVASMWALALASRSTDGFGQRF